MKALFYTQNERMIFFVALRVTKIRVCENALRSCDDLPKYSTPWRLGACGALGQTHQNASFTEPYPVLQGEPFDRIRYERNVIKVREKREER